MKRFTDERIERCLAMLKNPEFAPLLQYLEQDRQDDLDKLAQAIEPQFMYRLQGGVGKIKELLDLIAQARR